MAALAGIGCRQGGKPLRHLNPLKILWRRDGM